MTTGGNIVIPNAGNIGSASDTDAIAISSGGVVTMNQIPVFSAGINVSGGTIAGTLSTAAQGNVTSLGTLTTLTVDNIIINGNTIGHTSDTDAITIASDGKVTLNQQFKVNGDVLADFGGNVHLTHDGAILHFGANSEITLTHVHDTGIQLPANQKMLFGDGNDLEIFHDGSDSHIKDTGTGDLYISASDDLVFRTKAGAETAMIINDDGAVELYNDNAKKLETSSGGIIITGALDLNGAFNVSDDVDLSHDGTVLSFGADSEIKLTHNADVGLALNAGATIYRTGAGQYDAAFTVREGTAGDAHFEFGHSNTSGYGCTLGTENGSGAGFLAFNCGPSQSDGSTIDHNTYETHGIQGMVLKSASYSGAGELRLCHIPLADDTNQAPVTKFTFYSSGNLNVSGALSKGSGSFRIPHPLDTKKDTHDLVHSFIEGPQADLIYRGRATLVAGEVSVNIDDAAGMTTGTFEVLCRDVQCFTSNETGWTAVKGSVSGATLTIQAQDNSCTDTISWMVVGERKDKHMYETGWTDDDGRVIVEPEKSQELKVDDLEQ